MNHTYINQFPKLIKGVLLLVFLLAGRVSSYGQERISINDDWKFMLGDHPEALEEGFSPVHWRTLDVPHDWSIEGDYDKDAPMGGRAGYLPAGIGWYWKQIPVTKAMIGKQVAIGFDGVFMNSTVWVNGKKLGNRPYGWISFSYDISPLVKPDSTLTVLVKVDNTPQPAARWYTGSGIYANTWLFLTEDIHIVPNETFIRTDGNTVKVQALVKNEGSRSEKVKVTSRILNEEDEVVSTRSQDIQLVGGQTVEILEEMEVAGANKWSPDQPYLYRQVIDLSHGNKVYHRDTVRFGIREVEWKPQTGIWINGENIKLRGVCNHQDAGALGAAVPDKILRYRIRQLKDMGVNAIRTAHNPQTPQFYDMCDEMGMLVMDEIFDGWEQKADQDYGARFFQEWWERDLSDWIKRDRNHPSIIIYSLGNETHGEIAKDLVAKCHALDPSRPLTSGHSESQYMDVLGVNGASEKKGWFDEMPTDRVFIGTENTHTWQVRGFYRTKTWYRDGYPNQRQQPYDYPDLTEEELFTYDWTDAAGKNHYKQVFNSSYDNAMVRLNSRQSIELLRDIPNYAGTFRWTGHDYIGEATYVHGGWPFKAFMGGAIDLANFEKDLFYLYQSQWTTDPMVHILPHWTHPTLAEGSLVPVWVYSNCDEVELLHNGKSLGKKSPSKSWDQMQCQWMVPYLPGSLQAIGYKEGKEMTRETIRTAEAPSQLSISVDGEALQAKKGDIAQIRISSRDAKGEFYPYGENKTSFVVLGPGKIKALDNGSPIDTANHVEASSRSAFFGLTRAYIESTASEGDISVVAASILGEKRQITSRKVAIDVKVLGLRGKVISPRIEVYYTTNGRNPSQGSSRYQQPFEVEKGTTVRALVTLDGMPVVHLEESFGTGEGMVWDSKAPAKILAGDQAEDASYVQAIVSADGKGYSGEGYLDFGRNAGGYVDWYQENDGSAGEFTLELRYSASPKIRDQYRVRLMVNGMEKNLLLPATANYRTDWAVEKITVQLGAGANTIRFIPMDDDGFAIDQLKVN
ncbi:beta-galactosidase [Echinicola pacifica]|uniref:Beta-galactosidase n=1 Tax=Echinicola pacifica TaxID=346377 RepID=A0A918UWG5_9BACT|nr:glycoside hydrolase family 2 TIM barrel-domain containing protein [Echinicola pacifica]GGZ38119.1 beta-galactosidase [Echinicola pacifica]